MIGDSYINGGTFNISNSLTLKGDLSLTNASRLVISDDLVITVSTIRLSITSLLGSNVLLDVYIHINSI